MYTDPSGYMTMLEIGNVTATLGRMGSYGPKMAGLVKHAIGVDGKGGVVSLIVDAVKDTVASEFIGFTYDKLNERTGGTKIHTRLEKLIKEEFGGSRHLYGKWWLHIRPEVFFTKNKKAAPRKRYGGSLGVDILFYINENEHGYKDSDAKVILDFKTGRGWSNSHMDELQRRFGNITIIQIFIPIKYGE
jgi:hypothetical protein